MLVSLGDLEHKERGYTLNGLVALVPPEIRSEWGRNPAAQFRAIISRDDLLGVHYKLLHVITGGKPNRADRRAV